MTDAGFPSDDELNARDTFADAAAEAGAWAACESLPDGFRVELGGVMLWNEPRGLDRAPSSRFFLRFGEPTCVAFLTFDDAEVPADWPERFRTGEVGPFRLDADEVTLTHGPLAARLVAEAEAVEPLVGDPAATDWSAAHALLALRAGPVGLVVAARGVELLDSHGPVPCPEVAERRKRWWDYWQAYWDRKGTPDELPHDALAETCWPVTLTPETLAAWAADPTSLRPAAPSDVAPPLLDEGTLAEDDSNRDDPSPSPDRGDAHLVFAGAVAEMGLWTWWAGALPDRFQVELGNVMLWNAPRAAGQAPPNRFALSCVEPCCVAFLDFGGGAEQPDGWPERLRSHDVGPFELDGERFALGDHDRALAILAEARGAAVHAGDAREETVRAAPAVLAFRAGPVGLLVAAARIDLLDFSGAVAWDEVPARRARWWSYWREYWDRKDTADELPWDLLCEVNIPVGSPTAPPAGADDAARVLDAEDAAGVGDVEDPVPARPAEDEPPHLSAPPAPVEADGGAPPPHATIRRSGRDWLGAALPALVVFPIVFGGLHGVAAEEGISHRTAWKLIALVALPLAAWTLARVRTLPRDEEYQVGPTGVRFHRGSKVQADDDGSMAWSEMEFYRVRTSPRHGRRTLVVKSYGGRSAALREGETAEERAAFDLFLRAFLARAAGRVTER